MPLRLYADECVDRRIVVALRHRGLVVIGAAEQGLLSASDDEHMERAVKLDCTLVTADHDFLRIAHDRIQGGLPFPGLIFILPATALGDAIRAIVIAAEALDVADMAGTIHWVP